MNTCDLVRVRLPLELVLLERLENDVGVAALQLRATPSPEVVRRQLLGRAVRLTEAMAPVAVKAAEAVRVEFGLPAAVEIYQAAGAENAAIHLLREPILLEIQGRLLSLLDEGSLRAVIGHEFGHFVAHGPDSPRASIGALVTTLALAEEVSPEVSLLASSLAMARELTADRFALLATRDLDALLRLEMVATTGLPAEALGRDTAGYLTQCRELVDACLAGNETALGVTHPEHGIRAWAAWLFSESDLYHELTGEGAGTRPIAEVDALIERVLRQPDFDGSFQYLEAPPAELHELALAAAVLVATADGHLADEEAEVIEKTFSTLVSDWRRYLDAAFAAERLEALAPVAAVFGPAFQRPLFNLLLHVLTSDGVADQAEFQRIEEIGRLLEGEELFSSLMRSAQRRLAVERRESAATKPLPVKVQEAANALEAYLVAMLRRGGGEVPLRRLLRLVGATAREPQALQRIAAAITQVGLATAVSWESVELDTLVTLIPTRDRAVHAPAVRLPPGALERAIQRLRDELISGDGHSPSVRLREVRTGRSFDLAELARVSVGLPERVLAVLDAGKRAILVDGDQVGASKEAGVVMRQLVDLRREHLARLEETGARDLFLGTGFICGAVDGYVLRAPLLLQPVEIERAGEGGMALVPLPDEVPIANEAVLRAAYHKAGLPFGEEASASFATFAADPGKGVPAIVEHLRQAGFDVFEVASELHRLDPLPDAVYEWKGRRLELEACAAIGLFPQSNSELLEDYEQLLIDLAKPGSDSAELLGCARELLPASLRSRFSSVNALARDAHLPVVPVIPADPSQVEVVRIAREAAALVVDGPPGTGKSQVIVNLVADALARGERVAVVSEKRAALDVVANRLTGTGFGELVGVVHDVMEDRKTLYKRIQVRLAKNAEESMPPAPSPIDDRERVARDLRARIEHLRQSREGEPNLGTLATFAAGIAFAVPPAMPALGDLSQKIATQVARLADVARAWASLLDAGSPWRPSERPTRRSLAGSTRAERTGWQETLTRVVRTAFEVERLEREQSVRAADCAQAAEAIQVVAAALAKIERLDALALRLLTSSSDESVRSLAAMRLDWRGEETAWRLEPIPVRFAVAPELVPALEVLLAKSGSVLRWISPSWWGARGAVKRCIPVAWPDALGRPVDESLARDLHRRVRLARLWTRWDEMVARGNWGDLLAGDACEIAAHLDRAANLALPVQVLREHRATLERLKAWMPEDGETWRATVAARIVAANAQGEHAKAVREAAKIFFHLNDRSGAGELQNLAERFGMEAERVAELDRVLDDCGRLDVRGPMALAACADAAADARWGEVVLKAWAQTRLATIYDPLPVHLRGGTLDDAGTQHLAEVLEADAIVCRHHVLTRANEAPLLKLAAVEKYARRTPEQAAREKLQREVARQRGLMPLRTFVRTYADSGLFDALPVWLLSPETLAVLFPRKPVFDLVVFDEASQCTVASGFPALLRARRVVIAGDDRQMPPTSFFKAARDEDDADASTNGAAEPADFLDGESLLTLARQRVPARSLGWHYRCREEELIAFSNHSMYGGALLTCPSQATPLTPPALRWVAVTDANYADGRNEKEAERVVDLLHEALSRKPAPTVGVVTFNLSQRRTVLDAIDRRRASDAEFARVYGEAETRELLDDRPFVKNIENVQGDERDIILFSVGHAPVERKHRTRGIERYVPARFGPVGQRGGERRLNVAVSRARAEAVVVASFEPELLSVARAKNDGPRFFKAYLEYARHLSGGSRTLANRVLDLVRSSTETSSQGHSVAPPGLVPLTGQIAEALLARKQKAIVRVGSSRFRVDVAIEGREGRTYQLAILCDDGSVDDGAFRRTQRAALLRRRGWKIVHVDSHEWLENRDAVMARIERLLTAP